MLIFGECKSYGDFDSHEYQKMSSLAKMSPGATICFCTLKSALTKSERREIGGLARQGRKRLKSGQMQNPVLVLTATELFGQFKLGSLDYPAKFAKLGEHVFLTRDLQELCDFTQQVHLGMESRHQWLEARRLKRLKKIQSQATSKTGV